ncbi:Pantoate-beta-alanine ligase [Tilletiaria anomala UBC 951]|uniref:Pantoate--beta-alanine ligase n=1 Tax=Tilletiaria anomala (strain ATCC 24038 / CBS 436.72 / UBC 951) TaxID=1037660 RepID=A0A066W614_TILAU|nr:Pantoate-beta-alanine ligase [Tilletiaria anomala UBC 951]KDN47978.1 Pantoate-beta-alanine ligase [Tilletiaria anomala UBC 951]
MQEPVLPRRLISQPFQSSYKSQGKARDAPLKRQCLPVVYQRQYRTQAGESKSDVSKAGNGAGSSSLTPRIIHTVKDLRAWRREALMNGKKVGFVPTMGALHAGHLNLVQASLENNDCTVVSIFVNPAQFAPHEDLSSYPRTLPSDTAALSQLSSGEDRRVDIIFAPSVSEMYPSGLTQVVQDQVGAFVEVKGLSHQMEGGSRPTFFRGVVTVCTKLFHAVQPDATYFGQKDIQQSVILRRLLSDLLFPFPEPQNMHVLPTTRDPITGLALSSRNAYLSPKTREKYAPALYRALMAGQLAWEQVQEPEEGKSSSGEGAMRIRRTLQAARKVIAGEAALAQKDGVRLQLDYISLNDPSTLANLEQQAASVGSSDFKVDKAIMSGALLASEIEPDGKKSRVTRLIDNVLLGFSM